MEYDRTINCVILKKDLWFVLILDNIREPALLRKSFYNCNQVWAYIKKQYPDRKMEPIKGDKAIGLGLDFITEKQAKKINLYRIGKSKYDLPEGASKLEKIKFRKAQREKMKKKMMEKMGYREVIGDKYQLFLSRVSKVLLKETSFTDKPHGFVRITKALKYPLYVNIACNILRVLWEYYPGDYSKPRIAIKLYKRFKGQLKKREKILNLYKPHRYLSLDKAKEELMNRGFIDIKEFNRKDGMAYLMSTDNKLIYPFAFPHDAKSYKNPLIKHRPYVYHAINLYGVKGFTKVSTPHKP